jgi:hypothetical protein
LRKSFLFVYSHLSNFFYSYPAAVTISGDRAANLDLCLALMAFSSNGSFHATPAATPDLGLYGLISEGPAPTSHSGIRTSDARITRSLHLRFNHWFEKFNFNWISSVCYITTNRYIIFLSQGSFSTTSTCKHSKNATSCRTLPNPLYGRYALKWTKKQNKL